MQGFKGLIPKQLLADEAFNPIFKKAEDQRKATQLSIDFYQLICKFFESYSGSQMKMINDYNANDLGIPFYSIFTQILTSMNKEMTTLTQNSKLCFKDLTTLCNTIFLDFSKTVLKLQTLVRKYQQYEQILGELSKKYFRSHKTMLGNIDSYKISFTDVNLIYNNEEKVKRYAVCEKGFKAISEEYEFIQERSQNLTKKKKEIALCYQQLPEEFIKVSKIIGSKIIGETKNFVTYFCTSHKTIITNLAESRFTLEKETMPTFFKNIADTSKIEYFCEQNLERHYYFPLFIEYHHLVKDEYLTSYNSELLNYLKEIENQLGRRMSFTKKLNDFVTSYLKVLLKNYVAGAKEILVFFEKMKKKLGEIFGNRLVSFLKSVNSFFELSAGVYEKLIKSSSSRFQVAESLINEENKLLKIFNDELRNNIEKFIGKKELKKLKEDEFTEEDHEINIKQYRKQISQKAEFIKHFILGFEDKMKNNCDKLKKVYLQMMAELNSSIAEFYSLCEEYKVIYFGDDEFKPNYEKYQKDIEVILKKDETFFTEIPLNSLKTDQSKIIFDGDFSRIEDFKKLKKPFKQQSSPGAGEIKLRESSGQSEVQKKSTSQSSVLESLESKPPVNRSTMVGDMKQIKNLDFLMEKIKFKEDEKLIKSFACALSEKILLQGKIYITTNQICFHSTFNSSNVFFGGTFINFPKEHIKKIEKKKNGILIDNSISITTINGEVFFTSFFSRDEAYDLILRTFKINVDEDIYEFQEQKQSELPEFLVELEEDDDLKDVQIEKRTLEIAQLIPKFTYAEAAKTQIVKEGFNALKVFKLFYGQSQITIKKRTYPNFLVYMKQQINHKDLDVSPWDADLASILNKSNIKSKAPLKTSRVVKVTVPVSAAGVPFMPKTAKSEETQTLFFFSKNKWSLYAEVATSGAPYTDTFNVQMKTTCESDDNGKIKISVGYYVNFIKNTMMKAMIEGKTQEESISASKRWMEEITDYFVTLEKNQKNKNTSNINPIEELKEQLIIKNKEIDDLEKEREQLKDQIQGLRAQKKMRQNLLIGAFALIIILLLISF